MDLIHLLLINKTYPVSGGLLGWNVFLLQWVNLDVVDKPAKLGPKPQALVDRKLLQAVL